MRIHDDAGSDAEGIAEHDIRRLARHARQAEQLIKCRWHAAFESLADEAASALNRFGLVAEKAGGVNVALHFRARRFDIVFAAAIFSEQIRSHQVDALIGTL